MKIYHNVHLLYFQIYLQYRMKWKFTRLLRPFLQVICIYAAVWISLTRVYEYHHRLGDTLGGAFIGTVCGILTVNIFHYYHVKCKV